MSSFPGAKLDCMSHYAILKVKSNSDHIIINYVANKIKMNESSEAITEKTIGLAKIVKSSTNEVLILSIIPCRHKLADNL